MSMEFSVGLFFILDTKNENVDQQWKKSLFYVMYL